MENELYELLEKKARISTEIIQLQHRLIDLSDERNEINKRISELTENGTTL